MYEFTTYNCGIISRKISHKDSPNRVWVNADNEKIAKAFCLLKQIDVSNVEEIKRAWNLQMLSQHKMK